MPYFKTLILLLFISIQSHCEHVDYFVISKQARPFQIESNGQKHSGIVSDIVTEIFRRSPHTVKVHTLPFKRMVKELKSGRYPNWLNYGTPSWGSPQGDNLSKTPLIKTSHVVLSSKKNNFEYQNIEDLYTKQVLLFLGFLYPGLDKYIEAGHIKARRLQSYEAVFKSLDREERLKRKAVFIGMRSRILYNLLQNKRNPNDYRLSDFSSIVPSYSISLAYSPTFSPELKSFIEARLVELEANGFIEKTKQAYLEEAKK
mgnify:CR=1 FL=1